MAVVVAAVADKSPQRRQLLCQSFLQMVGLVVLLSM